MFEQNQKHFLLSRTQNLSPQQMLRARANGETFVSATMCRQQCVRNNVSSFARTFTKMEKHQRDNNRKGIRMVKDGED